MTSDRVARDADASLAGFARLATLLLFSACGLLSGCGLSVSSNTQLTQVSSIEVGPPDSKLAMGLSTLFEAYRWSLLAASGAALALAGLLIALSSRK